MSVELIANKITEDKKKRNSKCCCQKQNLYELLW